MFCFVPGLFIQCQVFCFAFISFVNNTYMYAYEVALLADLHVCDIILSITFAVTFTVDFISSLMNLSRRWVWQVLLTFSGRMVLFVYYFTLSQSKLQSRAWKGECINNNIKTCAIDKKIEEQHVVRSYPFLTMRCAVTGTCAGFVSTDQYPYYWFVWGYVIAAMSGICINT